MKKLLLILTVLLAVSLTVNSQIPNSGFEDWTDHGTYLDADGWYSCNEFSAGTFYPVTQSTDHFPTDIGSYSLRIENNPSLMPDWEAFGMIWSNPLTTSPSVPSFPITGHPESLTGYYKWLPVNGDTMYINVKLYLDGTMVAWGKMTSVTAASTWTTFDISLSAYTEADSASIELASFNANDEFCIPYGNSVLYVDNLNFDTLITDINLFKKEIASFSFSPNPASDFLQMNVNWGNNEEIALNLYNVMGEFIRTEIITQNQQQIYVGDLINGIYILEIKSDYVSRQRLIIQK